MSFEEGGGRPACNLKFCFVFFTLSDFIGSAVLQLNMRKVKGTQDGVEHNGKEMT